MTMYKVRLIELSGVDAVLILEFTMESPRTAPDLFIEQLAHCSNRLRQICVGQEWTFGANRAGSVRLLEDLAAKCRDSNLGKCSASVSRWSSRQQHADSLRCRMRRSRIGGKIPGRPFTIRGTVTEGRQRGRYASVFPLNLRTHNEQFPPNGVLRGESLAAKKRLRRRREYWRSPYDRKRSGRRILELHLFDSRSTGLWGGYLGRFSGLPATRTEVFRDLSKLSKNL